MIVVYRTELPEEALKVLAYRVGQKRYTRKDVKTLIGQLLTATIEDAMSDYDQAVDEDRVVPPKKKKA